MINKEQAKQNVERMMKVKEFFDQDWEKNVVDEEMLSINLRANEVYSKAVKKYLNTVAVIEFNTLRHIKEKSTEFENRTDMNNFIVGAIGDLKIIKERTKVQDIELRTLINFRDKVLKGKGKEYDVTKGFDFAYSEQTVEFEPFKQK